jgi:GDPmannose 4,6-dehydratase
MGNLGALRDWGHAKDYVRMQWLMLQQSEAEDYVIASGEQHSVREFILRSAAELGITVQFSGTGLGEVGTVAAVQGNRAKCRPGDVIVRVDPRYFRPTEVETLLGDPSKAREKLGWQPQVSFEELVREMVEADYSAAQRDSLVKLAGFKTYERRE